MDIRITNIEWDTDGEEVDLLTEMVVDTANEGIEDPNRNWLIGCPTGSAGASNP